MNKTQSPFKDDNLAGFFFDLFVFLRYHIHNAYIF